MRFTAERIQDLPEIMTVDEAAAYLHVSRTAAYEAVKRGELPAVRCGRLIRIPRFRLEHWLRTGHDVANLRAVR